VKVVRLVAKSGRKERGDVLVTYRLLVTITWTITISLSL